MAIFAKYNSEQKQVTIKVVGELVFQERNSFVNAYQSQIEPVDIFVLDLSETTFVDSSGLGMLLVLDDYAKDRKAKIVIMNPAPPALESLQTANIHKLFEIVLPS